MSDLIKKRLAYTQKVGWLLCRLPFVRTVILNGSLASGGHKESSDIDILIIAKKGRIFSCRFFINSLTTLVGIKRSKDPTKGHAGEFCFNYFLAEDFLLIPTGRGEQIDGYCADNYSKSIFIAGDRRLFDKFMRVNENLFRRYNCHPELCEGSSEQSERAAAPRFFAKAQNDIIKRLCNWFEKWARAYQIKKIESDPITKNYSNLIVYNDRELRFHPLSSSRFTGTSKDKSSKK